jgi:hypothetical protein
MTDAVLAWEQLKIGVWAARDAYGHEYAAIDLGARSGPTRWFLVREDGRRLRTSSLPWCITLAARMGP